MTTSNLTFNMLTFNHPSEEYTFYFYKDERENLKRVHKTLVPEEVIEEFGEQDHYYTSFVEEQEGALSVSKLSKPDYYQSINENSEEVWVKKINFAFSKSLLKRYYNGLIHNYFQSSGCLVKPNFVNDVEVWVKEKCQNDDYTLFMRFTVKVQIARITNQPELLISFEGRSKLFKKSVEALMNQIWIIR